MTDGGMAVVLVNLGTPEAPTAREVRRYLREFLSDRRVVNLPALVWRTILESAVLPIRSERAAAKYRSIWLEDGSPLLVYTKAQARGVAERLAGRVAEGGGPGPRVVYAMRYGTPSVRGVLDGLRRDGIGRVLVVPLYPQYSVPTVASVIDEVARHALASVHQLEYSMVHSYPTLPGYIEAIAARAEEAWDQHGRPDFAGGDKMLLSFHGIPESVDRAGDPYRGQCEQTAAAVRARLGLTPDQCLVTFQSKFGPMPWLTPATIGTVARLAREGVGRLDVACPGFAADCLETLEEIDLLNRGAYLAAKPDGVFVRHQCLNDHPVWLDGLADLVDSRLAQAWRPVIQPPPFHPHTHSRPYSNR
ncbi:MAG: ferrochelatase [Bifidobacteriaceae bacterium]|jgi:ferrochelatase|nr:ferrochelatase [Bifidobacteriaceae bacterium]